MRRIQVDVWSGHLHMEHDGDHQFVDWSAAAAFVEKCVSEGKLANVLLVDMKQDLELETADDYVAALKSKSN